MAGLEGYGVNCAYRYFPITRVHNGSKWTQNCKFWTAIIHTATCRFAKRDGNGRLQYAYTGEGGLQSLADYGIGAPSRIGQRTVWLGCKMCGTANLSSAEWKAKARQALDAQAAARIAARMRERQQDDVNTAKRARELAINQARHDWIEAHREEIAIVERQAAQEWGRQHPDLLALITDDGKTEG